MGCFKVHIGVHQTHLGIHRHWGVNQAESTEQFALCCSQLVLDAFQHRPCWAVSTSAEDATRADDAHQLWVEYELIDWGRVHQGDLRANCYCVRKGLIRKAQLAVNLKKWSAKHPKGLLARSVPETYYMDVDDPEYFEEALCEIPEAGLHLLPHSPLIVTQLELTPFTPQQERIKWLAF